MAITPAELVWRDWVTDGVPGSGANKPAKVDARGWGKSVQTTNVITPTALAANADDYAPTGNADANIWRLSTTASASRRITGLTGGAQGRFVVLQNINAAAAGNITIATQSTSSSAANRIASPADVVLRPGESRRFEYDGTAGRWVPQGHVSAAGAWMSHKNLLIVNNTGTPNSIMDVTADELILEDADGNTLRLRSVSVSPSMATSGAGGLDTGGESGTQFYFIWVIYNPATGTTSSLFSTSATAPTMPSGYTFKMRVGANYNDASSNFMRIRQISRVATYQVVTGSNTAQIPNIANGAAGTFSTTSPVLSAVSVASVVPSTAAEIIVVAFSKWKNGTAGSVLVAANDNWGGTNNGPLGSTGQVWPIYIDSTLITISMTARIALEAATIAWAGGNTGSVISCAGWVDNF